MKLIRWNPRRDGLCLNHDLDRLRNPSLKEQPGTEREGTLWAPPADLKETPDGFEMRLDLPGVAKEEIKVSVFGDTVTVSGERRGEVNKEEEKWHRVERYTGAFERQFILDAALDTGKVRAVFGDGVLSIAVSKAESAKPKEIDIEVGG